MVNTRFFSLVGTMATGRGNGSYGRHRLGTCPGFFPIGIYRTVTADAAGWESASASSRGSTTCSRLWDATGSESTPSSAYDQTRRGQRRKGDVPVSRLMLCGNLFPCRVQIAQWPRNDEMATRNRHVHVLGQVHRVRCGDRPGAV